MSELIVLKIGGSVCTEKAEGRLEVRRVVLERVGEEIARAKKEKEFKLVVVHGAGPFGHKVVKEENIGDGVKSEEEVRGFVRVHRSMQELNDIVLAELGKNLECVKVQPSAVIVQKGKKIEKFETEVIKGLLELGVVPVLHGDMVVDKELGASVISGDAIVSYLAKELGADRVLFGVNVEGIMSKGKLVERIDDGNYESVLEEIGGSNAEDVTGGMKGKVREIKENLKGIETIIYSMREKERTYRHLKGEEEKGTKILL